MGFTHILATLAVAPFLRKCRLNVLRRFFFLHSIHNEASVHSSSLTIEPTTGHLSGRHTQDLMSVHTPPGGNISSQ